MLYKTPARALELQRDVSGDSLKAQRLAIIRAALLQRFVAMSSRGALLRACSTLRLTQLPRTVSNRTINTITHTRSRGPLNTRAASHVSPNIVRWLSSKSTADEKIEEITELYGTARDEFEIAMEETEKETIYAQDDRDAAREELTKVQEAYKAVLEGDDQHIAEEVKRRIGQRIRELEHGVARMEEIAIEQSS